MIDTVLREIRLRTTAVCDVLDGADLLAPSELPGWDRLTIACHLRYGAEAMLRMTIQAIAGRTTAYYPEGRAAQRPGTLVPRDRESPAEVVRSLRGASGVLDETWMRTREWSTMVAEPADNPDLGSFRLADLPLMRLTEIEVHGTDLGLGLPAWSDVLIREALPMRLARLYNRTPATPGAWIVKGTRIGDRSEPEHIAASDRDLFALTLGRSSLSESFSRAFPGP